VGQVFRFHDFRFEILDRARHQITRLRVKPLVKVTTSGK
jgi:CBS domain containing-hemolysin-like protein